MAVKLTKMRKRLNIHKVQLVETKQKIFSTRTIKINMSKKKRTLAIDSKKL